MLLVSGEAIFKDSIIVFSRPLICVMARGHGLFITIIVIFLVLLFMPDHGIVLLLVIHHWQGYQMVKIGNTTQKKC